MEPNKRSRIWLGSYSSPIAAARAYDTALFYLRGPSARLNFPECVFEDGAVVDEMRDLSAAAIRQKATEVGARVDALQAAGPKKSGRAYEKPDLNESDIAILVAANTGNMELRGMKLAMMSELPRVDKWHKEDKVLDDQWVLRSRKKGREKGVKSQTSHLEGLKWEVIVVDEPEINAFCLPGRKIVVFTALLEHFLTDPEVATIIGHECWSCCGEALCRTNSKDLWLTIVQLILIHFFSHDIVNTMSNLFLRLPFSWRMEMEADYIGLLLLAAAGFDPRVAPQVYEKLGQVSGQSTLQDYLATHPSGEKRAQVLSLSQAKVMEEALSIYREIQSGQGVEGFL
ncbi:metalloendopeptidase [Castilleja foliolosa]|uniref:Metalloendopeptidase n=1 Tax=Castilleja foliolosa TaxID=1961234 RepID=A0ABD3BH98_9LAMI